MTGSQGPEKQSCSEDEVMTSEHLQGRIEKVGDPLDVQQDSVKDSG